MKPSQLELIIYKLRNEFEQMMKLMVAAYLNAHNEVPEMEEKYIDGKRVAYIEKDKNPSPVNDLILMMAHKGLGTGIGYFSHTTIPPQDAALVQELVVTDAKEVLVSTYFAKKEIILNANQNKSA